MTEEEKVRMIAEAFCEKIETIRSLVDWKIFIANISPQTVRDFLRNELATTVQSFKDSANHYNAKVTEIEDLAKEIK